MSWENIKVPCWVVTDKDDNFKLKDVRNHEDEGMLLLRRKKISDKTNERGWQLRKATLGFGSVEA